MPQVILYTPGEARRFAELARRDVLPFDDLPVLYALVATCAWAVRSLGLHLATADELRVAWSAAQAN
ncbi:MAG: hypothetical protein R3D05_23135 [Dongiaceae bacterium]